MPDTDNCSPGKYEYGIRAGDIYNERKYGMNRIVRIITEPDDPKTKLKKMMRLLADINAQYENTMFVFDEKFKADWSGEYEKQAGLKARRTDAHEQTVHHSPGDPYVLSWQADFRNHSVCRACLKYFNDGLDEEERAAIAAAYFPACAGVTPEDLREQRGWSRSGYYEIRKRAGEKLIRLWQRQQP